LKDDLEQTDGIALAVLLPQIFNCSPGLGGSLEAGLVTTGAFQGMTTGFSELVTNRINEIRSIKIPRNPPTRTNPIIKLRRSMVSIANSAALSPFS
jgi:hypothetical protein